MENIEILTGVPMPPQRRNGTRGWADTIRNMKAGDCCAVPVGEYRSFIQTIRSCGFPYVSRRRDLGTYLVWKTEDKGRGGIPPSDQEYERLRASLAIARREIESLKATPAAPGAGGGLFTNPDGSTITIDQLAAQRDMYREQWGDTVKLLKDERAKIKGLEDEFEKFGSAAEQRGVFGEAQSGGGFALERALMETFAPEAVDAIRAFQLGVNAETVEEAVALIIAAGLEAKGYGG